VSDAENFAELTPSGSTLLRPSPEHPKGLRPPGIGLIGPIALHCSGSFALYDKPLCCGWGCPGFAVSVSLKIQRFVYCGM
jgi:hypothetical protein